MSKGNLFLGFGRGKVGDVVFSHVNGEQVTRARNRKPKNPQTVLQLLQRVIVKTTASAYSAFREITDHSFQGSATGTPNQSRFTQANVRYFREMMADIINTGDPEIIMTSDYANFNPKDLMGPLVNPYVISEGTIPSIPWRGHAVSKNPFWTIDGITAAGEGGIPTYAEVVSALGLKQGDQLTFCAIIHDDTATGMSELITGFEFARIILEPDSADMSTPFLSAATNGVINSPNERNEGTVTFDFVAATGDTQGLNVKTLNGFQVAKGIANSIVGVCVIVSREVGGVWQRSSESFYCYENYNQGGAAWDWKTRLIGDAIYSYMAGTDSTLYLNQAETGF